MPWFPFTKQAAESRVCWREKNGQEIYAGGAVPTWMAEAAADEMNGQSPEIEHWVEPEPTEQSLGLEVKRVPNT